jgi:hypothetical protein
MRSALAHPYGAITLQQTKTNDKTHPLQKILHRSGTNAILLHLMGELANEYESDAIDSCTVVSVCRRHVDES